MKHFYFNPMNDLERLEEALELPWIVDAYDQACRDYLENEMELEPLRIPWATKLLNSTKKLRPIDVNTADIELDDSVTTDLLDQYICHGMCHWAAWPYFLLADELFPNLEWNIYQSKEHTAVIDTSVGMIFDLVFAAYEVPAESVLEMIDLDQPIDLDESEAA